MVLGMMLVTLSLRAVELPVGSISGGAPDKSTVKYKANLVKRIYMNVRKIRPPCH